MSLYRKLLALLVTLMLGACGYQLQGAFSVPPSMAKTYIDTDNRHSTFFIELRKMLRANGVQVVDAESDATAVFHVHADLTGQRVLSVSARNVPREYEVFYTVQFSLEDESGVLLDPQLRTLTRAYTYDETRVLGKAQEEEFLRNTLVKDLVRIVLRRLSSI